MLNPLLLFPRTDGTAAEGTRTALHLHVGHVQSLRWIPKGMTAQRSARGTVQIQRGIDALLLLTAIAEPHPDHLLVHVQALGQLANLLRRWLAVHQEGLLQRGAHRGLDGGALLAPASQDAFRCAAQRAGHRVDVEHSTARLGHRAVRILQPFLEQRLQLAHVLEAQIEGLET